MSLKPEKPAGRMKRKVLTENLWYFILKLISRKPLYGREIRAIIKKEFGFVVGSITAYKVLYSMEAGAYVKREKSAYRSRYSITAKGKAELKNAKAFLRSVAK
jgi:DNA-binding PadR family transcriptional regulator